MTWRPILFRLFKLDQTTNTFFRVGLFKKHWVPHFDRWVFIQATGRDQQNWYQPSCVSRITFQSIRFHWVLSLIHAYNILYHAWSGMAQIQTLATICEDMHSLLLAAVQLVLTGHGSCVSAERRAAWLLMNFHATSTLLPSARSIEILHHLSPTSIGNMTYRIQNRKLSTGMVIAFRKIECQFGSNERQRCQSLGLRFASPMFLSTLWATKTVVVTGFGKNDQSSKIPTDNTQVSNHNLSQNRYVKHTWLDNRTSFRCLRPKTCQRSRRFKCARFRPGKTAISGWTMMNWISPKSMLYMMCLFMLQWFPMSHVFGWHHGFVWKCMKYQTYWGRSRPLWEWNHGW